MSRAMRRLWLASLCAAAAPAIAADKPTPSLPAWTGLYIGGHFGYGTGTFGDGTNAFAGDALFLNQSVTGFVGGYQVGYTHVLANNIALGLETSVTFGSAPRPNQPI